MPKIVTAANRRFKAMPFGDPGTAGKTTWACGAQDHPLMSPVLVIDSEDGLLSVAGRGDIAAEECRSIKDYETILGRIAADDPVFREFKTIVTDSGSDLLDKALREEAGANFERAAGGEERGRGGKRASRTSADELFQKDYGTVTTRMKRLFDIARGLPKHSIITSLPTTHYPTIGKDENGNDRIGPDPDSIHPAFTAKLGNSIRGLMDFVWYFYREPIKNEAGEVTGYTQKFLTQEHGPYKCKTRGMHFPKALGLVSTLTLPEVYDLLITSEGVKA